MCQCSQARIQVSKTIPIDDNTREVAVRLVDGQVQIVLIDHADRVEVMPLRMLPEAAARRAA